MRERVARTRSPPPARATARGRAGGAGGRAGADARRGSGGWRQAMAYNLFLVIIVCVVVPLVLAVNAYLIVHYQHPQDRNQAWLPKAVVLLGLSVVRRCHAPGAGTRASTGAH